MKGAVVHHYPIPERGKLLVNDLPGGTKIIGAQWRKSEGPSVYVEKPFNAAQDGHGGLLRVGAYDDPHHPCMTLEAFFVATGAEFELEGFTFVETVTPDRVFFFHVYARLS